MIRSPSSNRSNRPSNGKPNARNSGSFQPAPRPRITRPPDTSSSVSAILARSAGFLKGAAVTYVPRRTRDVVAASALSSVHDSQAPCHSPSGSPKPTWSEIQTASNPSSSAVVAIARRSAHRGVAPAIDPST
jgi:hypothetical protein